MLPPLLRLDLGAGLVASPAADADDAVKAAVAAVRQFTAGFDYAGAYHTNQEPNSHHREVGERLALWLSELGELGVPVSDDERRACALFGDGHDCVHNARRRDRPYTMSVRDCLRLYGVDASSERSCSAVRAALNSGIRDDNARLSELTPAAAQRAPIASDDEALPLSDEELSNIVVDAAARRAGVSLAVRAISYGLIEATEFARSLVRVDGQRRPGSKYPRTQLELAAKLADMGNWEKDCWAWLHASVRINSEAPAPLCRTVESFIAAELAFLSEAVAFVIDHRPPGSVVSPRSVQAHARVVDFLHAVRRQVEALPAALSAADVQQLSPDLQRFLRCVAPLFDPSNSTSCRSALDFSFTLQIR